MIKKLLIIAACLITPRLIAEIIFPSGGSGGGGGSGTDNTKIAIESGKGNANTLTNLTVVTNVSFIKTDGSAAGSIFLDSADNMLVSVYGGVYSALQSILNFTNLGPSYLKTNVFSEGTNDLRWVRISGGLPSSAILFLNSGTNVVGSTNLIYDSSNGRIGIATNSPQDAIHIHGTGSGNARIRIRETALAQEGTFYAAGFGSDLDGGNFNIDFGSASTVDIGSNGIVAAVSRKGYIGYSNSIWAGSWVVASYVQPSNNVPVLTRVANSNAIPITNIVGLVERGSATPIAFDCNLAHQYTITNRITAATTLVFTNTSRGQEYTVTIPGEASGGTSRVITLVPTLGDLVANLDVFGTALAANMTFTLTNGNAAEVNGRVERFNGTNIVKFVTRQYAF